jgi:outer membrane protein TolC
MRNLVLVFLGCLCAQAETRTLTLKEAVNLALQQNPDLLMARLDEQKAALGVDAIREPLAPRVVVGSGLAYSNGFPMSIEGSAPAVLQAKAIRSLYDPQRGYQVAQARELTRGAALGTAQVREEVALRTAVLFLDLERAVKSHEIAARQLEHQQRIEAAVRLRVAEGRELPVEGKRAAVNVARARQRVQALDSNARVLSQTLARILGLPPGDAIVPAGEQRMDPAAPESEQAAVEASLRDNPEIRRLESELAAKTLESKAYRAAKRPRIDLVAQYGLLARFNNYEDFFRKFQRHNGQLGASIQVPLFANTAEEARAAQASVEAQRLRLQIAAARGRIESGARQAWLNVAEAEMAREVAKLDLDAAREQVSVVLAQYEEGRATARQLDEARLAEEERWLAWHEARYQLEKARLELLKQANTLSAALR